MAGSQKAMWAYLSVSLLFCAPVASAFFGPPTYHTSDFRSPRRSRAKDSPVEKGPLSYKSAPLKLKVKSQLHSKKRESEDEDDNTDSWDSDSDYDAFNDSVDGKDDDDFPLNFNSKSGKLGIDIGKQMGKMSKEEVEDLKREAKEEIEKAFANRLDELEDLKKSVARDFEASREALSAASDLRAARETENLMNKIDRISESFLSSTKTEREATKQAAAADKSMAGRGLDIGSWGTDEYGREVATAGDVVDDESPSAGSVTGQSNVLIVIDSKSSEEINLAGHIVDLIDSLSNVSCELVNPMKAPLGGGRNTKTAVLFSSCFSDRGDVESLLDKILKRTADSGFPPSHVLLLSSLGTERTNKLPYSMQNLLGGKLDKLRGIEEAIISRSKLGVLGGRRSLDYTILKIGQLKPAGAMSASKSKLVGTSRIKIAPGDSLDGDIEISDAADVVFQSIAMQRYARNSTLAAVTDSFAQPGEIKQAEWDDMFLKLDGPELVRILLDNRIMKEDDAKVYELLCQYISSWAKLFEDDGWKRMGLTTPVTVSKSNRKGGVRIEFKPTKTGAAYKSSKEERAAEVEREKSANSVTASKKTGVLKVKKATKEGGVEVVVEQVPVLRVRARRCNMDDSTVVKEMSEQIIIKRLKDGIDAWVGTQS